MDVRDYVPYLKSWKGGTAVPTRRQPEPPIPASYAKDDEHQPVQEGSEVAATENAEVVAEGISNKPLGSEVDCKESASSVEAEASVIATPARFPMRVCHYTI